MLSNHFSLLTQGIRLKNGCFYKFTNNHDTTITRTDKNKVEIVKDECWFLDYDEIYINFVRINN